MTESDLFTKICWANLDFCVTSKTFIPRASSLAFIEIVDKVWNTFSPRGTLIDMCCGSGALGIAVYLARAGRFSSVVFLDSSPDAVLSAEANRAAYKVPGQAVQWRAGEAMPASEPGVIICNPPFLEESAAADLPAWEQSCVSCAGDGLTVISACLKSISHSAHALILKCLARQLPTVKALACDSFGGDRHLELVMPSGENVLSVWIPAQGKAACPA